MGEILETLKKIGTEFIENTGLSIVRAVAFLALGLVIIKVVQSIARGATLKSRKLDNAAASFVISVITVVLYIALIIVIVSTLGFTTAGIIAAFSAVALAVALALKDSLASLANGVIIIFTKPFKKGDYVEVNGIDGLVQDIRLFNTKILTYDNVEVIIPNSEILTTDMINYSAMPLRRVVVDLFVHYEADTTYTREVLLQCASAHRFVVNTPAPAVVLKDYTEHALIFSVRAWTPNENYWDTLYELKEQLLNALKENNIKVPFNRVEINLLNAKKGTDGEDDKQ